MRSILTSSIWAGGAAALLAGCGDRAPLHWADPVLIAPRDGTNPTIAIDGASGTAYVAWAGQAPDTTYDVWFRSARPGADFGAPKRLNAAAGELLATKEFPPQVVVGGRDTLYVAWVARSGDPSQRLRSLRITRSLDGGASFDSVRTIGADLGVAEPTFAYYDIAAAPGGTVVASWLDLGRYVARAAEAERKKVTVDPWNDPSQSWAEEAELRFARSTDGGVTFATAPRLDSIACICCRTAVAAGPEGDAFVMWRHVFDGSIRDFVVARAPAGGAPASPVRVHEDRWKLAGCPDIGPDLAADSAGRLHAAWYTGAPGRQGLHYARSADDGASFEPPVGILTGPTIPTSEIKLAVAAGTTWLVWEDQRARPSGTSKPLWGGNVSGVQVRFGWIEEGRLRQLGRALGDGRTPAIAIGSGRLGVAWASRGQIVVRLATVATSD